MKRKHRVITVAGNKYGWLIQYNGDGDGGRWLVIFRESKKLYDDKVPNYNWETNECINRNITPKYVETIIKGLI